MSRSPDMGSQQAPLFFPAHTCLDLLAPGYPLPAPGYRLHSKGNTMSDTTADTIESTPSETDPNVPYRCRYLTTKGEQCRQIALNGRNFCFAHRDPEPDFGCRKIKVPILEDSASIQLMLTKILHGLLNDHFPVAVASKAIYCCQVAASTIARPVAYRPKLGERLPAEPLAVMEIYKDQQGNLMGPLEEFHLPPAPEPDSARAKARAEWN